MDEVRRQCPTSMNHFVVLKDDSSRLRLKLADHYVETIGNAGMEYLMLAYCSVQDERDSRNTCLTMTKRCAQTTTDAGSQRPTSNKRSA